MKTILLIDDDTDEFLIFSEVAVMLALPLNFVYNNDPLASINWLKNNTADFIFIDMLMPKITGIELMQKMQALPSTINSKFVIVSTYIDDRLMQKALAAGATTCIQKADTVTGLTKELRNFFAAYQL